jgi:hypothetical protein
MRIVSTETIIVDLPTCRPHHLAMATINSQGRVLATIRVSSNDTTVAYGGKIGFILSNRLCRFGESSSSKW